MNIPTENALLDTLNCGGDGIRYLKSMWEDMIEALWDGSIPSLASSDAKANSEEYFWSNIVRGNVDDIHKPLFDWCLQRYSRDAEDSAQARYEAEHDL